MLIFGYRNDSRLRVSVDTGSCVIASNGDRHVYTPPATLSQLQDAVGRDHQR